MRIKLLTVFSVLILTTACGSKKSNSFRGNGAGDGDSGSSDLAKEKQVFKDQVDISEQGAGDTGSGDGSGSAEEAAEIRGLLVDYGFKDFSQLYYTMAAITGVDPENQAARSVYEEQLLSLPNTGNDIKSFVAAHQSAIFKLGTEFCDIMMNDADLRAAAVPNFDFNANYMQAFDANGKQVFAMGLIDSFWDTDREAVADTAESTALVNELIDSILADTQNLNQLNEGQRTLGISKGVCISVITALPVSVL